MIKFSLEWTDPHACLAVNTLASEPPSAISLLLSISDQQKGMVNIVTQVGPHTADTVYVVDFFVPFCFDKFLRTAFLERQL